MTINMYIYIYIDDDLKCTIKLDRETNGRNDIDTL